MGAVLFTDLETAGRSGESAPAAIERAAASNKDVTVNER
jgi:hypothetical protein